MVPKPLQQPTIQLRPQASVLRSTGAPVPLTPVGFDTGAQPVGDPTLKQTVPSNNLYSLACTPIKYSELCNALLSYPHLSDQIQLRHGFKYGFPLHYAGPRLHREAKNLKSARLAPQLVEQKLNKEVKLGRMAGPYDAIPFPTLRVSPVGLVPKKDGDQRLIHHLSYPEFESVNDYIDPHICTVKYSNVDEAVLMIQKLGQGALLAKSDLKSAFRLLPIYPGDFDLLGIKSNGKYYYDKCLPFGSKLSCALFNKFSSFLHWLITKESGNHHIIHYLDDFLFGGKKQEGTCGYTLEIFHQQCEHLGVPISQDKTVEPTTCLVFLGIEFDTISMHMRLPQDKLVELRQKIQFCIDTKKITLRELQSLIGSLNFACQVVAPGRAFIRRLVDATVGIRKPSFKIRVSSAMKLDLETWLLFLQNYNGITLFPHRLWCANETINFYTDSAGGKFGGFGIFFEGKWAFGRWPKQWDTLGRFQDLTFLEMFPVVAALTVWGPLLANKRILFHIDNQAVVHIINKQTSKSQDVMVLVRRFVLKTMTFNINFRAEYIHTKSNAIADSISRCQWSRFRTLAPQADPMPTPLPPEIWQV